MYRDIVIASWITTPIPVQLSRTVPRIIGKTTEGKRERERESLWGGICIERKSRAVSRSTRLHVPNRRRNRCWEKDESLLLSGILTDDLSETEG